MSNLSLAELITRIDLAQPRIIAIDGPAGAGKTTLANRIAKQVEGEAAIVHMDDLYDGWEDALTAQLTRTLTQQILAPVRAGKIFGYRKYDWLQKSFGPIESFPAPHLLILEGVGSGQKSCAPFLDHLIWIDIPSEIGLTRVLNRDGDYLRNEIMVWQLREADHFEHENTRDRATIRLDGNFFI